MATRKASKKTRFSAWGYKCRLASFTLTAMIMAGMLSHSEATEISIIKSGSTDDVLHMEDPVTISVLPDVSYYMPVMGGYALTKTGSGYLSITTGGTMFHGSTIIKNGTLRIHLPHNANHQVTGNGTPGGAILAPSGGITLGDDGFGMLTVSQGGKVDLFANTIIKLGVGSSASRGIINLDSEGTVFETYDSPDIYIGMDGQGEFNITNGAQVTREYGSVGGHLYIGGYEDGGEDAVGNLTIDGDGSSWRGQTTYVGYSGKGSLEVLDGGYAFLGGNSGTRVGVISGSEGYVSVDGTGAHVWSLYTYIGDSGFGRLTVKNGGLFESTLLGIGESNGGEGVVAVRDTDSSILAGGISVGKNGNGELHITNGATVTTSTYYNYIGENVEGTGTVCVDGEESSLIQSTGLYVGNRGSGYLSITNGGYVETGTSSSTYLAYNSWSNGSSNGAILVDGIGSKFKTGRIEIASNYKITGKGELSILNGGKVELLDNLSLNNSYDGYSSYVTVDGSGSELSIGQTLAFGNGAATVKVLDGAYVSMDSLTMGNAVNVPENSQTVFLVIDGTDSKLSTVNMNIQSKAINKTNLHITNGGLLTITGTNTLTVAGNSGEKLIDVLIQGDNSRFESSGSVQLSNARLQVKDSGKLSIEGNLHASTYTSTSIVGIDIIQGGQADVAGHLFLGDYYSSATKYAIGTIAVDGVDNESTIRSQITSGGAFRVGNSGKGSLSITNGAQVIAGADEQAPDRNFYVGYSCSFNNTNAVIVDGVDSEFGFISRLESGGDIYVGRSGLASNSLSITKGAQVVASNDIYLGYGTSTTSHNRVFIDGRDSILTGGGTLHVGRTGNGELSVTGGASVFVIGDITVANYYNSYSSGQQSSILVGNGSSLITSGGQLHLGNNNRHGYGTALLSGSGAIAAEAVTVYRTGHISAGDTEGQVGVLTIDGNLAMQTGSTISVDLGSGNTSDRIDVSGTVTAADGIYVDLSSLATGSYAIVKANDEIAYADGSAIITLNGEAIPTGGSGRFSGFSSSLVKDFSGDDEILKLDIAATVNNIALTWKGNSGDAWDLATENWEDVSTSATTFFAGDSVAFDKTGGGEITFSGGNKTVADMTVSGEGEWVFHGGILADAAQSTLGGATGKLTIALTGLGSATLNGNSIFRGGVDVVDGTLHLAASQLAYSGAGVVASDGALSLADGAYFGNSAGTGSFALSAASDGSHSLIVEGVNNVIQAASIAIASDAVIAFDAASLSNASSALVLQGRLAAGAVGSQAVDLLGDLPDELDRLRLITVDNAAYLMDNPNGDILQNGVLVDDDSLGLVKDDSIATLILAKGGILENADLTWTGNDGSQPTLWDIGGANNWHGVVDGSIVTRFVNGDTVVFGDEGAGQIVVAANGMAGSVTVAEMRVNNSTGKDYVFTGGGIESEGTFLKEGEGTVVFANNAIFASTTISEGVVLIGNGGGSGSLDSDVTLASDTTLAFDRTGTLVHNGAVEGAGSIEKEGTGTVVLAGNIAVQDVAVNAGFLGIAENNSIRLSGTMTVKNGASLQVVAGNFPAVTADSIIFKTGSGMDISGVSGSVLGQSVTLATANQAIDALPEYTIDGAALVDYLTARLGLANNDKELVAVMDLTWNDTHKNASGQYDLAHGTFTVANEFHLNAVLADREGIFTSDWDGETLTKKGAGTLILAAANTYGGDTIIDAGIVRLVDDGTVGNGDGKVVFSSAASQLAIAKEDDWHLKNELAGAGSLFIEMLYNKTVTIDTANTGYTGNIAVNSGVLKLENAGTLGTGGVSIQSGASLLVEKNDEAVLANALAGAGSLLVDMSGDSPVLSLTAANNDFSGNTTVQAGTLRLIGSGTAGSGAIALAASSTAFEIANGATVANVISGDGMVIKTGVDTATLSGDNSFSGGIDVQGGKLKATGIAAMGDNSASSANQIAVGESASLETRVDQADSEEIATFFSRISLGDNSSFAAVISDDVAIQNDLLLASAGDNSTVELMASGSALTLENAAINVDGAAFLLGSGAILKTNGSSGITASRTVVDGGLVLSAASVFEIQGDVEFNGGASIAALATTAENIGRLSATGSIVYSGTDSENVRVYFGDDADIYVDQSFLHADSGISGIDWLKSDFYKLELRSGTDVFINGTYSFNEIMDNLFGPGDWSVNLQNGADYTDDNWTSFSPDLQGALLDYLETLDNSNFDNNRKRNAFLQLYGEYAAEAGAAHHASLFQFTHMVYNFIQQQYLTDRMSVVLADASGTFSGNALASPTGYGRRCMPLANRIWGTGFGSWAKQRKEDNINGYKHDSTGFILGYDHWFDDRFQMGFAAAYSKGRTKIHELATKYDSDILNVGVYGRYVHESNVYASASVGFAYGWNEYDVNMISGGKRHAKYHSRSYSANLELGYICETPLGMNVTPYTGVNYSHIRKNGWRETATNTPVANWFGKRTTNTVDIPVGIRIDKIIPLGNGCYLAPEIKAAWIHSAGDHQPSINGGYVGSSAHTTMRGVNPGRNRWQFGAGVKARINKHVEAQINYDLEVRKRYTEHNLSVGFGVKF